MEINIAPKLCETFKIVYIHCKLVVRLDKINLSNEGLTKFFSPIEADILKSLWREGEMTISTLTEKTDIPMTSIAGTLDRLVKAGFAKKHLEYKWQDEIFL